MNTIKRLSQEGQEPQKMSLLTASEFSQVFLYPKFFVLSVVKQSLHRWKKGENYLRNYKGIKELDYILCLLYRRSDAYD